MTETNLPSPDDQGREPSVQEDRGYTNLPEHRDPDFIAKTKAFLSPGFKLGQSVEVVPVKEKEPKLPLDDDGLIIIEDLKGGDYMPGWGNVIRKPETAIPDVAFDHESLFGAVQIYKFEREYAKRLNQVTRLKNDGADQIEIDRAENAVARVLALAEEQGVPVPVNKSKKK